MKIVSVRFNQPRKHDRREVIATLENGSEHSVFSYYTDELHFNSTELVGLTRSEAVKVFHAKDMAYIRS